MLKQNKDMEIQKYTINDYSFYLEDYGENKGKVIITGWNKDENYSYFWSSMGMDLKSFLQKIDNGYFLGKLMPREQQEVFSIKNTGRNIRKIWKAEIMKWYEHQEFQKDFREKLNDFLNGISCQNQFVYEFNDFIDRLDFYLIEDRFEREFTETAINDILKSECWHLIETETSSIYKSLSKAFTKLKKELKSK